jgi:polyphenol oxidase
MTNQGAADAIEAPSLAEPGFTHAFFTRRGGVSTDVYATLNGGVGSRDSSQAVAENRRRMALALGVGPDRLLVPYQVHSADALVVTAPWGEDERPRCDALVTDAPGLALGVTGADCGMILFQDAKQRVIGAAHAGWKGALGGVLEATIASMEGLGARRADIRAALGPTIGQSSYEVGPEFVARFCAEDPDSMTFFARSAASDRAQFNLPGYIGARLRRADIAAFEDLGLDTYADETRFFSYRRTQHRKESDYGRLVSAIVLK